MLTIARALGAPSSRSKLTAVVAALLVSVSCGGSGTTDATRSAGPAAQETIVSGEAQSGVVGTQLAAPLVVRVVDANGTRVPNQVVNFVVTQGGGAVFGGAEATNA